MHCLRFLFVSTVAVLVLQPDVTNGLLGGVGILNPLLLVADELPLNFTDLSPIKQILSAVNLDNYPNLESSIIKYNSYTSETRPKCCRPDQFPDLFTFLYDLFAAIETIGKLTGVLLCEVLQLITPLSCNREVKDHPNDLTSLGCVVKCLLGSLFGRVGELGTSVVTGLLTPLDVLDGCLITGIAQVYFHIVHKEKNSEIGDAVGPVAVVSTVLGFIFALMYCLGEPLTSAAKAAYMLAYKNIIDVCEKQIKKGLWRSIKN